MCKQVSSELIPGRCTPGFDIAYSFSIRHKRFTFVEPKPFGFTSFISYAQLYLNTGFTLVAGPWFRLVITSESRSIS
jgi:hypothetical protein